MGMGLRSIAERNFGPINSGEGFRMARNIQDTVLSPHGRAMNMDMERVQQNILGFDAAGGFSNVTSAGEMETVLQGVVENTRAFANAFRMRQEEAVQIMAELQQSMIVNTDQMGGFASDMAHAGRVTGLGASGITQFGMQGVNMLSGTGMNPEQRFNMAVESRLQTERLRFADPVTRQLVTNVGGADQAAFSLLETTNRFMMSGAGLLQTAALAGGAGLSGNLSDTLAGASNFLAQDPFNVVRLGAIQGELTGAMGFEQAQAANIATTYRLLESMGMATPDEDLFVGWHADINNMDPEMARLQLANFRENVARNQTHDEVMGAVRRASDFAAENRTTRTQDLWAGFRSGFSDFFTSSGAESLVMQLRAGVRRGVQDGVDWGTGTVRSRSSDFDREATMDFMRSGEFRERFEAENMGVSDEEITQASIEHAERLFSSAGAMRLAGATPQRIAQITGGLDMRESRRLLRLFDENFGASHDTDLFQQAIIASQGEVDQEILSQFRGVGQSDLTGQSMTGMLNILSEQVGAESFRDLSEDQQIAAMAWLRTVLPQDDNVISMINMGVGGREATRRRIFSRSIREEGQGLQDGARRNAERLIEGIQADLNQEYALNRTINTEEAVDALLSGDKKMLENIFSDVLNNPQQVQRAMDRVDSSRVSEIHETYTRGEGMLGSASALVNAQEHIFSQGLFGEGSDIAFEAFASELAAAQGDFTTTRLTERFESLGVDVSGELRSSIRKITEGDPNQAMEGMREIADNIGTIGMDAVADSFRGSSPFLERMFRTEGSDVMQRLNSTITSDNNVRVELTNVETGNFGNLRIVQRDDVN